MFCDLEHFDEDPDPTPDPDPTLGRPDPNRGFDEA